MPEADNARDKTRELQSKLNRAAKQSPTRRFHQLYDKVYRRDFLELGWQEVKRNQGAAGVDKTTIAAIKEQGVEPFLEGLASELKDGTYRPQPVRRVSIPKSNGAERPLGIPAVRDRVVQAAAKAVLEPIFEADFLDCSFGFRPGRSQRDALETVRDGVTKGRRWVVDADIKDCFGSITQEVLLQALTERISDRKMLKLVMGWMRAGVMTGNSLSHPETGIPQGGVISPLLANIVLHRLDRRWRTEHWRVGLLVRFADDFVILCPTKERAEAALVILTAILGELSLELARAKTRLVDMYEQGQGFDFLGFHHRRVESRTRKGKYHCARWPSERSVRAFKQEVRARTSSPALLLTPAEAVTCVNVYLRGWRNYYRYGNSTNVFLDLDSFVANRCARLISRKHRRRGRGYGYRVLNEHARLGLIRLTGSVRYGPVNAVR